MKRTKSTSPEPHNAQDSHSKAKRCKLGSDDEKEYNCGLLDLSDDVLLHIFKYLSAFDLMSLFSCCVRLNHLCCDRTLWKKLDLSSQHLSNEDLEKYHIFLQPITKLIAIRGNANRRNMPELQLDFLKLIESKCSQLQELSLENFTISREKIQITDFPKTLKKLTMKGCQLIKSLTNKSYLSKIDAHMPELTCLIITNCQWLNTHSFMAISKIPNLREVRLKSCHGLSDDIAYFSLACKFGLKNLQILDLRDTFIGDSVVSSFSHTSTLTEMYLECPLPETEQCEPDRQLPERGVVHIRIQQQRPEIVYQDDRVSVEVVNENHYPIAHLNDQDRCHVSDRSVCSLSLRGNEHHQEIIHNNVQVQLLNGRVRTSTNPNLKKLVVRNYSAVTNQTLQHFSAHGPNLEYLDVTGTSVTKEGLQNFKIQRPEVTLISSFTEL